MKYRIILSVDNNRYGCYFKRYAKRVFEITADNAKEAYYLAAEQLKKEKRYKNAIVRGYANMGDHDFNSFSINLQQIKEIK
jgi:hypothetical protein